eukprot:6197546-Pleurochrysis_carterae.AAC.1
MRAATLWQVRVTKVGVVQRLAGALDMACKRQSQIVLGALQTPEAFRPPRAVSFRNAVEPIKQAPKLIWRRSLEITRNGRLLRPY